MCEPSGVYLIWGLPDRAQGALCYMIDTDKNTPTQ